MFIQFYCVLNLLFQVYSFNTAYLNSKLYHDTITHIQSSKPSDLIRVRLLDPNCLIDICQFCDMLFETNPVLVIYILNYLLRVPLYWKQLKKFGIVTQLKTNFLIMPLLGKISCRERLKKFSRHLGFHSF